MIAGPAVATPIDCALCGDPIRGDYIEYDTIGWDVCTDCARHAKCESCGLPCAGSNEGDDGWCRRCLDAAPRCASCGLPIRETYWKVTGSEARYCDRCMETANECSVCGAPDRSGRFRDGRFFCGECNRDRVDDGEIWEAVYERLLLRADTDLGLELREPPPLVVDNARMLEERHGASEADGLCGLYVRDARGNASIHVLSHLPASRGAAVLAHELAHAWQAENCPEEQGTRIREGFAEWMAWRLLDGWEGGDRERAVIEARIDEYGVGFRLFRDLEARNGTGFAVWYASAARSGA